MPIFEYDGKKYNVREEHIDNFMKDFPDATSVMERDGKKYRVKSTDYKTFMSEQTGDDVERQTATTAQGSDNPVQQQEESQPAQIQQAERRPQSQQKPTADKEWRAPMLSPDNDGQNEDNTIPGQLPGIERFMHEAEPETGPTPQYEVETANREQVAGLTDRIHEAMNVRGRQLDAEVNDPKNWWADIPRGSGGAIFTHNSATNNRRLSDLEYRSLSAADNAMRNAQAMINEADAARRDDKLHDWAATKFVKGAARGLGEKLFDARTWDLGLTDVSDNLAIATALDAYEDGKPLTESQQIMLDAKAVELATNAYFGSYIGRGYKAGSVTAESIPFMIEMCINPASSVGSTATSKLTRYAIKRFGTQTLKKSAGKFIAAKGAARVTADVAGSMTMAATTGAGHTTADAIDRMNGNILYDTDENGQTVFDGHIEGEDFGTAFSKAFAATTIENYSEMFGNYFSPVLGAAGKVVRKGADAVGLGRVNRFIDDVAMSDVGRLVADFEKNAQWNGLIGEYAEEVAGGIMNALVVGDQTLNTDENTGVFNLDQNIDTFLGVSLMGGFLSSVKTAGYRTPKYRAKKAMSRAERNAANSFSDPETWENIRGALESEDNMQTVIASVLTDSDYNDDQKRAVLSYVEAKQAYDGTIKGEVKRRFGGEELPEQVDAEQSFDNGYSLETPQEMQDAKNMYDYQRQRMLAIVSEETLTDYENDPALHLEYIRNSKLWDDEERSVLLDYLNAKATYDGMIQRVRDDIDGRVEQSNAMVDARTHHTTGMIQPATMKADDRRVYVICGNLVQYADGSGIDNTASDSSIIVRDAETGALEQVAPDAILNIDGEQDANEQKQIAEQQIKQQFAQEAADKIDGVASFNPGDTYSIAGEQGDMNVQIVANEAGIVDNGDGTVNATTDGTEIITVPKEVIQQQVDAANIARVAEFEQARAEENIAVQAAEQEALRPAYAFNDNMITLRDENGNPVRGSINNAGKDADGRYEVVTETPINGKRVNQFTQEEIDSLLMEHNGAVYEQPTAAVEDISAAEQEQEQTPATPLQSAFERVPKDEQGNPLYEQADSDTAWDAIIEQTEGDENMAQTVADGMVADKEAALKKAEKAKSKGGATIAEKIAAEKERTANIAAAKQELDIWKQIANVSARRKADIESERRRQAEEAAKIQRAEEEKRRAEREEAERIEREALNGVPDMVNDTPQDARARGYRRVSGHKIDRQEPVQSLQGKEVSVRFSDDAIVGGHVAIIDASQLQPSHIQGQRNPRHFIDEAQPKERNDQASVGSATKIASHIRPEEITSSVTAYTGAPTINARGEVIQGNNRGYSLRLMWTDFGEQAERYRQYLKDHAADFGLTAEDIDSVQNPVLVNMLDVDDDTAIALGQYVAQDTESGGVERIKPKNTLQKMGANMRTFANMLLKSTDDETSFAGLVDRNGTEVLKWMNTQGFITATQFKSAFDSKGNLTPEAKNDLRGIMYNSIFQGGSTLLEEMFNAMPAKAQKAILSTAYRDYDSPSAERMVEEIQNSIRAYYALSQDKLFAEASNFKDARMAVESWKRQYQIDDATGESYLPTENFSNFALHLATMYKGETQSLIQGTFNKLYDLIQGAQEENLFEQPDNTPRTLAQAIYETLNFEYDGQSRSDVLAGDSSASQRGQQGSTGNAATGERIENRERTADSAGSIEAESTAGSETVHQPQPERKGLEQTLDGERQADSAGVADDNAQVVERRTPRGDIRVLEEGLDAERWEHSDDSERTRRTAESERLVSVAKQHGLFIPAEVFKTFTGKVPKRTGESVVYIDKETGKVTKVKDPYAKSAMKSGVQPEDAIFEHRVHNLLFPETAYTLEGISEELGDVRFVLTQNYIQTKGQPTKEQIAEALAARGLFPEDNYSFGNELVSVTDVEGDNVLLGEDGTVYFIDPIIRFKKPLREILAALGGAEQKTPTIGEQVQAAEAETDTNPTDAQKAAGNYKKGHVQVGTFNVTVENPKGSVRSGVDASGKKWQTTMNNTYGYIRGTEGVDGDHIDVFLSDDIDGWDGRRVFVIDQYNTDGTFDEHKVMLGFNSEDDATAAYLSNYEKSWADDHKTVCSSVIIDEFEKWIDSSHRKTKPFADYKTVKHESVSTQEASTDAEGAAQQTDGYTVEKRFHKKNNTDIYAVKFTEQMPREQFLELKKRVKDFGGYYSSFGKGGFIFNTEADARRFAEAVLDPSGESLDDAAPLSLKDMRPSSGMAHVEENATKNEGAFGLVSDERMEELKKLLRQKMSGQLNAGFGDLEILNIGLQLTAGYLDRGLRKFADYAKQMIDDFGDVIRPYLKAFYNGARDLPDVVSTGMSEEMDSYDEVSRFDIANFGKNSIDPFATAEMVVAEQDMQAQAADAKQQIVNQRNSKRRKENEQTTADTLALAEEAEAVASEAETLAETATDEREINRAVEQIDETLDRINDRLALLGYYEFDEDDNMLSDEYGYMLTAEKKAVKDATNLAKQLVEDLGIEIDKVTSLTTLGRYKTKKNTTVSANLARAGGTITIRLPLKEGRELAIFISLYPVAARGSRMRGDNLAVESIMYRIEEPAATGLDRYGINRWVVRPEEATYDYLLQLLRGEARKFLPGYRQQTKEEQEQAWRDMIAMAERGETPYTVTPEVEAELAKQRKDNDGINSETVNGYRRGDEVLYDPYGTGKWEKQRIVDFEKDGRPVFDSFGTSVITEIGDWSRIKPANGVFGEAEIITRQMSEKKGEKKTSKRKVATDATIGNLFNIESELEPTIDGGSFDTIEEDTTTAPAIVVPEQRPVADLIGDSAAYQERETQTVKLVEEICNAIEDRVGKLEIGPESVKSLTMTDIKRMAAKYSALKDISDTDLQELVELAMTQLTRSEALVNIDGTAEAQRSAYDHIVSLYQMQPSLNARDSERLIKQQYSTPTPFGFVMGQFVRAGGKAVGSMLEPSAGNGALTIAVHPSLIHVNDIDEARLANLRKLDYGQVTAQDALLPFSGDKVDVVMTNPPFGAVTEKVYDGVFRISSLESQMAINALEQMKDDGRAAIVIGGNTNYRTNGSMNPKDAAFFGYLYSHYNVADVINISGKALYYRSGTGYDVRIILIDGRKTGDFQRVYPPVKAKARAEQITTFDELYKRIQDDIQQIQQVGSQPADVQRDPGTAADGTASAPVRSGNNRPNTGAGQRPGTAGDAVRNTPRTHSGQPTPANDSGRPVGVDNADTGNAGSTDNVPQPKPQQPRSVGSGSAQNGTGRSGSNGRGAVASRPDRGAERLEVRPDLTTEKVPYPNQSDNGFTLMSVVPAAQAQVLQKSLGEIGDVDQYLVDELGYSSKEELYSYLAAEQIDSVALAIHQMNKGNAFIIGDMTGVGKGRQGAALIRYAVKQGKVPIYFTQKPTLYTDNYRDLADIGSSDLRPFIIASNAKDANIVDVDGNLVHKLPSKKEQERVFNYIMEHGTLPNEYDYVLTTYDQIKNGTADYSQNEDGTWKTEDRKLPKKSKGYTTADYNGQVRRDALARLAEGNIAILDESHTVGGDSGCGRYMQMLTSQADGVTFLSATFAKRADNMPIYAQRTAIAEAGVKASELIEAIIKGGVTLQEIMSKQLVESGQMIRRERSFEGVTIDWLSVAEETDRHQREQFNEVADIFNSIRNFQDDYITPIIDAKNEAAAEFGATVGHTQGTKDLGVKNVPFASKMYNLVNQLLFALKVDAVADRVVENLRNGFKPVISFTNTMEGFLSSAPKGVAMDDVPNFSLTLMRALDGVMRYTETDADENSEGGTISLSQLSTEGQNTYNAIRKKIMNLSADLPISPMDAIRMKIEEAGYSVAEITGRTMQLNRTDDGRYIVEARKDSDKKAAMRDFNAGKLDVLMINKSGSTGISLHASSKFGDQRPRVMVFAQFQSDINDEVQMRGRIDRSGQVTRGRYEYIMSTIPAEQRIQMMFKAKLKSLDANTTSSQKSKFNEMEIVDYLNKYGDEVVWEYMKEHPELEERLGDPLDMLQETNTEDGPRTSEKEDTSKKSGCAGKISRYLAFLSVEEQDEIFREITESYRVKIQLLDDAGENDLEITTMPLRAETKRKRIWHEGENPGSGNAFADNTYVEEVEVDVLKKPMKRAEIENATRRLMGDKLATATEYDQERYGMKEGELNWRRYADQMQTEISQFFQTKADEAVGKLKETGEARIAKAREKAVRDATKARSRGENNFTDEEIQSLADTVANETREKEEYKQRKRREEIMAVNDRIISLLTHFRAGSIYVVPQDLKQATLEMFSQTFGAFVGFKFNKSYTLGSSTAIFATLDGRRKVELALSDPAIQTIIGATNIAYRYSPKEINAITMENWDSKVPTQTRQKRYIITGNLLQALVDTEKAEKTKGNLISFSTIDGEIRQGILMGENFKLTDLLNSASLSSRLAQIREGQSVVSENGDVQIEKVTNGWHHRGDYELRVPKSKQRGGIYTMHPDLLQLVDGHNFISKGNNMVAYVAEADIAKVVDMLSRAPFDLTVLQESKLSDVSTDEAEEHVPIRDSNTMYRSEDATPQNAGVHPMAARREMAEQVYNLAKKLNLDNVEVVTRVSGLQGKKATAKGFYTKSTGKITVVIPNNTSLADAQRTLLHEAVAHYGLRQMFGVQFDTFLDNVFDNADKDVRERIVALAAKNSWDFRKATEEYLAQLAENTEFEQARQSSWWQKIKDFFVDMLNKIGFADFDGATLTDNELRYILWRSYENLKEGAHSSVFSEAADTAKQYELNVGEFDPENDILRRDGDPEMHERALARERYEQRVRSGMFQSREAIQDSMLGLKEAMFAILGKKMNIEDVDGFENAYLGENRLSSVNKAEADAFARILFKPMLAEVARLAPTEREREELTDYMMAKHGLERNRVMAERDARKAVDAGSKKSYDELLKEFRKNDYAGLTALTGLDEVDEAEAEAERMVADYENDRETDDLWEKVNAVSKAILQKSYECGMMDKQTFEAVSDMYEFYIPLRGFDEKTSAEAYAYLSHRQSAFNAPIKRAQGRKSKADDPFANLQSMAESAIVQGNRNKLVKQKFLNFVLNHPSDLVSVNDLWLQYDNVTDEWRPVFPDNIGIDDTPDEVEQKMQNFEAKMSSLAEAAPDTYKRGRDAVNIPYRVVESRDLRQHQVIVKRNGRDYLLTINGNPRAAQALNGQTNPDNENSGPVGALLRVGEKINRQLSAFYTTRNPDFIVSNFVRDLLYSNAMTWVKESPNYALRYHRNYITKANPKKMKSLLSRYRKGTLNMDDATDAMFHQFMMNGGETGYANVRDIEQHKNDIRKELRKANGKLKIARAMELLGEQFDELNRAIENCARFAAFITSREMGRSLDRAIYDAKEISVNFNKKGSGAKFYDATGQTNSGNVSALVSGLGRSGFVFWNAAIQGTTNFGKQLKRHPAKAYTGAAALFLLGVLIAYLGGDDDDDDKNAYYNLPEYVRRSNILFSIGDHWISIPLPIESRAFYGMGELMTSLFSGKEHLTDLELASAIAGQATQILPIDFLEGGGGLNAFIPSSVKPLWEAYVVEKGWTGMPLYKNTPYNKDMPEWTKAYGNANRYIVGLANALNESTGGDAYTKGAIDLNPAKIEYMLNGYFGGVFGTIDKLTKTAETIVGAREYDPRSILLMNRLVKAGDERTEFRAVNKEYFRLKEEHDRLKARLKHYEDDTDNGVFDYAEKIDFLYNSPEYERYEIFEDYRQEIDDLYEELKETVDEEERKEIEAELNEVKKEMISEINLTRNRK